MSSEGAVLSSGFSVLTLLIIALTLNTCPGVVVQAQDNDPAKLTTIEIDSLAENCLKGVCRDFHFDNSQQVAYFDLMEEVHINDEQRTYELSDSLNSDTLVFENCSFVNFPLNLFYTLKIKELDMRNCAIEQMTWENFLMSSELRLLLLSDNLLQQIDELTFNYASNMQYLFLDGNRLERLVSESFKGMSELKLLDLHNNLLQQLPLGLFDYCPELQELNLAQNQLRTLQDGIFKHAPNMLTLLLQQNDLHNIGEYAFKEQQRLILLDISHNPHLEVLSNNLSAQYVMAANCSLQRINVYGRVNRLDLHDNRIQELYFSEPASLDSLNLRNNSLQQIASLRSASRLRMLDLSENPELGSLPDPWHVGSLEHLDLSNTGMLELPIGALTDKSQLKFLNISHNQLGEIDPRYFKHLDQLTHFYIHANNWNCFNLNMLMDLLIRPRKMYYRHDTMNPEFPGEYVNGIACMYRIPDQDDPTQALSGNYILMSEPQQTDPLIEVKNLRKELKTIVSFYESKFSKAFDLINELKGRLDAYERLNDSINWQHITITT